MPDPQAHRAPLGPMSGVSPAAGIRPAAPEHARARISALASFRCTRATLLRCSNRRTHAWPPLSRGRRLPACLPAGCHGLRTAQRASGTAARAAGLLAAHRQHDRCALPIRPPRRLAARRTPQTAQRCDVQRCVVWPWGTVMAASADRRRGELPCDTTWAARPRLALGDETSQSVRRSAPLVTRPACPAPAAAIADDTMANVGTSLAAMASDPNEEGSMASVSSVMSQLLLYTTVVARAIPEPPLLPCTLRAAREVSGQPGTTRNAQPRQATLHAARASPPLPHS
jgi:hypothetical protein